jgi:hypothetical protein
MDATSGKWLFFRVLGEPSPARGGAREWRLREITSALMKRN